MSRNVEGQSMEATRDKIQNWLMSEGWQISEPSHPDFEWLIRAEDVGERRILVGQNKANRLLLMNVDFVGVAEPIQGVILTQRIYLDGLTKDAFIQRFLTVRNAVIAVIWSTIQYLEDVKPPAKSTEKTKH